MEIRENPYEELDIGGANNDRDHTVEMADVPFDDGELAAALSKKKPGASPLGIKIPAAGSAEKIETLGI